jgi:hypothetical protein
MGKLFFAFLLVFILAQSTPKAAHGAPGGSGRASMEKAAKKACITGNVKVGIDILADLYLDTADTTLSSTKPGATNRTTAGWKRKIASGNTCARHPR